MHYFPAKTIHHSRRISAVAAVFLSLLLILKVIYAFGLRIDSDETQHLHVVWGWANGLLPYRDLFDNHSPLFQFLCAPIFRALGERADIVVPMRFVVIPLYGLDLWLVYKCGTLLFSRPVALSAVILAGAYPSFFIKSSEFRTDDLWALFWLLTVWLLLGGWLTIPRAFIFGLALGASFATSMKTTVLALGLFIAVVAVLTMKVRRGEKIDWRLVIGAFGIALVGAAFLPLSIVAFFASKHALPDLYYGTIGHNIVPRSFSWLHVLKQMRWFVPFTLLTSVGWVSWHGAIEPWKRDRIAIITLSLLGYFVLLAGFWPIVQSQDFVPVIPLVGLLVAGGMAQRRPTSYQLVPLWLLASAELVLLLISTPPRPDAMTNKQAMISTVLSLTDKNDFVMDAKGESVFRSRPFYYVLEGITARRLAVGLIADDIPERLIATRTPVAMLLRMPPRAHDFIEQNYVPVAFRTRVLGKMLNADRNADPRTYEFNIAIPEKYTLVSENGGLKAALDGIPANGPRFLEAGHHRVDVSANTGRLALVWDRAIEKGFSPFVAILDEKMRPED